MDPAAAGPLNALVRVAFVGVTSFVELKARVVASFAVWVSSACITPGDETELKAANTRTDVQVVVEEFRVPVVVALQTFVQVEHVVTDVVVGAAGWSRDRCVNEWCGEVAAEAC
jgi:hypothetical protein